MQRFFIYLFITLGAIAMFAALVMAAGMPGIENPEVAKRAVSLMLLLFFSGGALAGIGIVGKDKKEKEEY